MATTAKVRRCTRIRGLSQGVRTVSHQSPGEPGRSRISAERATMSRKRNEKGEPMPYLSHYDSPLGAMTMGRRRRAPHGTVVRRPEV